MKVLHTAPRCGPRPEGRVPAAELPHWDRVLAVVAHPDDESFGLGAVLAGMVGAGAEVGVLCLTHGEASTLHGVEGDLRGLREGELAEAAEVLGARRTWLLDHPDGALSEVGTSSVVADVLAAASTMSAEAFVVFDPSGVTGHPDHVTASAAALRAADVLDIPVLGWTLGRPTRAHAVMPPATFDTGRPLLASSFAARAERWPDRHTVSTVLPAGSSEERRTRSPSGMWRAFGACPACHSCGSRTSSRTAPCAARSTACSGLTVA